MHEYDTLIDKLVGTVVVIEEYLDFYWCDNTVQPQHRYFGGSYEDELHSMIDKVSKYLPNIWDCKLIESAPAKSGIHTVQFQFTTREDYLVGYQSRTHAGEGDGHEPHVIDKINDNLYVINYTDFAMSNITPQ